MRRSLCTLLALVVLTLSTNVFAINNQPKDIVFDVRGLELLVAFREPYSAWDSPAIVLAYFDDKTNGWVPVLARPYDGYNNHNNSLLDKDHAWEIAGFVKQVNDLIWSDLPFDASDGPPDPDAVIADKDRFAAFLKRVLKAGPDGFTIDQTELDKGW